MLLLYFLLLLLVPVAATLLFKTLLAHRIGNDVLRLVAVGLFYVVALLGYLWGTLNLAVSSAFNLDDMYPVVEQPIDDTYYFTQQEYGFVTMMSSGYNLTFYRQRPFWRDDELGKVQLECSGKETIQATVQPAGDGRIRLRIAADAQQRLDTTLDTAPPFNFRRTFQDRIINYANRP